MSSAVCSVKNVDDQVDVTQSDTQSVAVLEKSHLACKYMNTKHMSIHPLEPVFCDLPLNEWFILVHKFCDI